MIYKAPTSIKNQGASHRRCYQLL